MLKILGQHVRSISITRNHLRTQARTTSMATMKTTTPAQSLSTINNSHNNDWFNFTRGKFVVNEQHEYHQHHVQFNVQQLAHIAVEAVGSNACIEMTKYPDGIYNKAFLLTMDDGKQVVAKVPNPNAGRPHDTVASEVATMEMVRTRLATPVPKVYTWSADPHDNAVGAEYIIMEKVAGIPLGDVWHGMCFKDRVAILTTIVKYQKSWISTPFTQFGSIYYAGDRCASSHNVSYTNSDGITITDPRFSFGPTTARCTNDDGRSIVDFDRGPWSTLEQWAAANGQREAVCIRSIKEIPKSPINLCGPGTYQPNQATKLKALDCYAKIMPYLLPTDHTIQTSHLWHCDLHEENIFVNPHKPTEVVGIIDWQSSSLEPLFMRGHQPCFLDYDGPPLTNLERPALPSNLSKLDNEARHKARNLYRDQSLVAYYRLLLSKQLPPLYRAFEFKNTINFDLLFLAQKLLVDGEAQYLAQLLHLESQWPSLPRVQAEAAYGNPPPFPLHFFPEERRRIESDLELAMIGMDAMTLIKTQVGPHRWPERGCVSHEYYDASIKALQEVKEQVIDHFSKNEEDRKVWEACWPLAR